MPINGVPRVITPDLLHVLSSMGHGDEIVLADAHFPTSSSCKASTVGTIEVRLDSCDSLPHLFKSVLKLIPLDDYAPNSVFYMDRVQKDKDAGYEVKVWKEYQQILDSTQQTTVEPAFIERFEFYERAKKAFAIVHTGDDAKYGNVIVKKGLVMDTE